MERNFLIVAADGTVRQALAGDLRKKGFKVTLAENGAEAERIVQTVSVRSVLVESHLPDMSAAELRKKILEARPDCRVITLTSFGLVRNSPELLRFGAGDYLLSTDQVFEMVDTPLAVGESAEPDLDQGQQSLIQVIDVLVGLLELEYRNFSSSSHQAMTLAKATAEEMGAGQDMTNEVVLGTLLRDVGKVGLEPDAVIEHDLSSDMQFERVQDHVSASLRLFEHVDFPWKALPVIRHHHECYNGSGFPEGLRGREIPMGARIVAVVDAYVSLTHGRGDGALNPEQALQELVRRAGHQFDPEVVESFHRVIDKRLTGRRSKRRPVVLVVEPQDQFRQLLKMRLINEGLDVDEADSYDDSLEHLLKDPPDLVLVDIDADTTEAFGLLQELQQDDKLRMIPVAFLSRRSDRLFKIRALRHGVDDFLSKADDMEELVARVENIIVRQAIRAGGEVRRSRRGITGDLVNLSLPDIVQTLTIGMKTACVTLASDDRTGTIWFENGTPTHAEAGELTGEDAFYGMVRWTEGEFVIEHGVKTNQSTLNQDAMFLLMEGLRLMDEASVPDAATAS